MQPSGGETSRPMNPPDHPDPGIIITNVDKLQGYTGLSYLHHTVADKGFGLQSIHTPNDVFESIWEPTHIQKGTGSINVFPLGAITSDEMDLHSPISFLFIETVKS